MSKEPLPVWNLVQTAHVVGLRFAELFATANLTPTQFAVLMHLEDEEGLTQAGLARRVLIRPQTMGVLVTALIDRGLVVREGLGGRGRRAELSLTNDGRDTLSRAWPSVRAFNTPAAMGLTPAQAAMLEESLEAVRGAMNVR